MGKEMDIKMDTEKTWKLIIHGHRHGHRHGHGILETFANYSIYYCELVPTAPPTYH
jgi:hypothetical protein